jgi:hypothetical protein
MDLMKRIYISAAIILFSTVYALAQTTSFAYQGSLQDNALPANSNYDFAFALFDAPSGGNQIGATITQNAVLVANGLFAVTLDFGSVFTGPDRYLEIRVGLPGAKLTTLTPRQLVNSAPYSVKSLNADTATNATNSGNAAQLGGVPANQYVLTSDSRLSDARPPTAGSANYIQNGTSQQSASNFYISGSGTVGGGLSVIGGLTSSSSAGNGVNGLSGSGDGVLGASSSGTGVYGTSTSGIAVYGSSTGLAGVFGTNSSGDGVAGNSDGTGAGVHAHSQSGYGLLARSETTHAIYADGSSYFNRWIVLNEVLSGATGPSLCRNSLNQVASCSVSSIRYKKNIGSFNAGLDVVRKLTPVTFDWISDGTHDFGLIAEEVEKVAPQLVVYEKGRVEGVRYDKMGVFLINAVKEQQAQIERQQKEIENLKALVCTTNKDAEVCKEK